MSSGTLSIPVGNAGSALANREKRDPQSKSLDTNDITVESKAESRFADMGHVQDSKAISHRPIHGRAVGPDDGDPPAGP